MTKNATKIAVRVWLAEHDRTQAWLAERTRTANRDRRWIAALIVALLTQPLGWLIYIQWALGAIVATWRDAWSGRLAVAIAVAPLGLVPFDLAGPWWAIVSIGSLGACALGLLWLACVHDSSA